MQVISLSEPALFELWQSHQLSLTQFRCLRILQRDDYLAGDLAKRLGIQSTSLTRLLERLEARQLVERVLDHHDRRRIWVRLTDEGRRVVSDLDQWLESPIFQAIQELSEDERERLATALNLLADRIRTVTERAAFAPERP